MFNGVQVPHPAHAARSLAENTCTEAGERASTTHTLINGGHSKRGEAPQKIWEPHPVRVPHWV